MFNVLLDELPKTWNGYLIDTDFQTGIQISQCLIDDELTEMERIITAISLLFIDERPSEEECIECLEWYLNEFNHDNTSGKKTETLIMDFNIDQWRIYTAFLSQYRINLNTTKMHWFEFMGLVSNLEECTFTRVMDIRNKKITSKMSNEEKKVIKQAKNVFQIKKQKEEKLSAEDAAAVNTFLEFVNGNQKPLP